MKIENEYKPNTNQIDSQFFAFHLLSQCIHSQICNEKKKRAYINTKSYFIYFKTPLYNLSNILFIIFHITLNTVHFLFISLSFSLSLSLHSSVSLFSLFTHISNPIAKKRKKKKKKKTQQPLHPPRIYHHHHNHNHHHHIPIPEFK